MIFRVIFRGNSSRIPTLLKVNIRNVSRYIFIFFCWLSIRVNRSSLNATFPLPFQNFIEHFDTCQVPVRFKLERFLSLFSVGLTRSSFYPWNWQSRTMSLDILCHQEIKRLLVVCQ